jgi:hypothetical protein
MVPPADLAAALGESVIASPSDAARQWFPDNIDLPETVGQNLALK